MTRRRCVVRRQEQQPGPLPTATGGLSFNEDILDRDVDRLQGDFTWETLNKFPSIPSAAKAAWIWVNLWRD